MRKRREQSTGWWLIGVDLALWTGAGLLALAFAVPAPPVVRIVAGVALVALVVWCVRRLMRG